MRKLLAGALSVAVMAVAAVAGPVAVDPKLPSYKPAEGVSGTVRSVGSDTMNNIMTHWQESFKKMYPAVTTSLEGKGSSTAPPALVQGTAEFGPMSRPMKNEELDAFEKKFGYKPVGMRTGIDALAIFVHKDAPIDEISMKQARAIFSVEGKDMTWGDLGVKNAEWATKPISLYGRNSASGTYGYFKEHVLGKKDYKPSVKEQPGSSAVVQGVAADKFGMGYSGIGYKTADVKALKVKIDDATAGVAPTAESCLDGSYPIARFLLVYVNAKPGAKLSPVVEQFIRMIYSKEGQESVVKDGYIPLTADLAREDLTNLGLSAGF